jgi:glycolate oxidase FAD binding subunit
MIEAPSNAAEVVDIVRHAAATASTLGVAGGSTRSGLGRPVEAKLNVSLSHLCGITLYEPAELVMSAEAGTPLADIETVLAEHGQMLAFEPLDHAALYDEKGQPTIGGVFASNASGPRRLVAGAARDHLLGAQLVNGSGESIRAGGRVMKNVTGLDIAKLMCGSMGTLGILTNVTFKITPRPETSLTLTIPVASIALALATMTRALGSPYDVSGAAYLPDGRVMLRLEGFAESVDYRAGSLIDMLAQGGRIERDEASAAIWKGFRSLTALTLGAADEVWKVSVAPSKMLEITTILPSESRWLLDWSGGLLWLAVAEPIDALLRGRVAALGGHATLVRADRDRRQSADVFMPMSPAVAKITRGIKRSFDPRGIFNPGRMYEGI